MFKKLQKTALFTAACGIATACGNCIVALPLQCHKHVALPLLDSFPRASAISLGVFTFI